MRPRLYISWGQWLGARAAALLDAAVRDAYGDCASSFYSGEIKEGASWFDLNEGELDAASAAVVLLTSDGLQSHWQAYELGRLRGRGVPCTLLMLDVNANMLGATAYAHLNCSQATTDVLRKVIGHGRGGGEGETGRLTEQQATRVLELKWQHLLAAFERLQQYKSLTGRARDDRVARNMHLTGAVYGFCSAGLSGQDIAIKLRAENVPGAAYIHLFETSPCKAAPRVDGAGDPFGTGA